jgi:sugar phosphate isomerase/epimerase
MTRRRFCGAAAGLLAFGHVAAAKALGASEHRHDDEPLFRISLAEWSLHKLLYAGAMDNLDFPAFAAEKCGIHAIEYVNSFFKDKAGDAAYLKDLNARCDGAGVRSLLIMCDGEGDIGDPDKAGRLKTVENHRRWIDAAAALGCHAIRVNAASRGTFEEQQNLAADGLSMLCEAADPMKINVLVENHGGLSSNGAWLAGVMRMVDHPRCGTLPDFGNFLMDYDRRDDPAAWYDRYKGVGELMPYAKAVSAKSHDFDSRGDETGTDYARMLKIVADAGYRGYVGVEYEGSRLSPLDGVIATRKLLERVRDALDG